MATNFRIRRYLAKVTINPATCFGVSDYVGSITPGKLADLVFWRPQFFIAKPEATVKGGFISHAVMGDPNGSLMTGQPLEIPAAIRLLRRKPIMAQLLVRHPGGDRKWPRKQAAQPSDAGSGAANAHHLKTGHGV